MKAFDGNWGKLIKLFVQIAIFSGYGFYLFGLIINVCLKVKYKVYYKVSLIVNFFSSTMNSNMFD